MKYAIEVTITAKCTYTVEVEARSEAEAEDTATGMWRDELPDDFQVEKGYITDWDVEDAEQLTWECNECEKDIPQAESDKNDGLCDACNAVYEAEERK